MAKASDSGTGDDYYANSLSFGAQNNHAAEPTKNDLTFEPTAAPGGGNTATALYDYAASILSDILRIYIHILNTNTVQCNFWMYTCTLAPLLLYNNII